MAIDRDRNGKRSDNFLPSFVVLVDTDDAAAADDDKADYDDRQWRR